MPKTTATRLIPDPEIIEAIAVRVVELLGASAAPGSATGLVDAAAVARELGVERDWVYDHAEQLGVVRLGSPRGRLRFDMELVRDRLGGVDARSWRPPRRVPRRSGRRKKATPSSMRGRVKSSPRSKAAGTPMDVPGR
jgi:hypothetical protein